MKRRMHKGRKRKIINGIRGSISIFLCLTILPFLGIATAMIEHSRYSSAYSLLTEISDLASLSALADFDTYLKERFGLFAMSQETDVNSAYESAVNDNSGLLKGEVKVSSASAKGAYNLTDPEILKNQITDFGECTVLSEMFLEDFNLQVIFDKLSNLDGVSNFLDSVSDVVELTEAVKTAAEAANNLKTELLGLKNKIINVQTKAKEFYTAIADFYQKIAGMDEYPANGTEEEKNDFFNVMIQDYNEEFKKIFAAANSLDSAIDSVKTAVTNIPGYLDTFINALDEAAGVFEETNGGGSGEGGSESEAASNPLEIVINSLQGAAEEALDTLESSLYETINSTLDGLQNQLEDTFLIWNPDTYFQFPLSDHALEVLEVLINNRPATWHDGSYDEVLRMLKGMFFPNIDVTDLNSVIDAITNAVEMAEENLKQGLEESFVNFITSLVNTVRNLFNLDVFYDNDLNAYLSSAVASLDVNNPYQSFLNSVGTLLTSVETFVRSLGSWDLFGMLKGISDFLTSIGNLINSIFSIVTSRITNIVNIVKRIATGKGSDLYDLFLIAGYATHNFPNRTSNGDIYGSSGQYYTELSGKALTGFPYSDIPTAGSSVPPTLSGGLLGMVNFLNSLKNQGGNDLMLKGAELEYIVAGTRSEVANQVITFMDIYMMRLLLNIVTLLTDVDAHETAASATIAAWAVYLIIIVAEPFVDMILMVNGSGKPIPLIKTDLYLSPSGIADLCIDLADVLTSNSALRDSLNSLTEEYVGKGSTTGTMEEILSLDYETYVLLVLLINVSDTQMLARIGDLIRLEATEYYKREGSSFAFTMSKTYTCVQSTIDAQFKPFIDAFGLGNEGFSLTIKKTRGY